MLRSDRISHCHMGFWRGSLARSGLPGAMRNSQATKPTQSAAPMTSGASTAAEPQPYVPPAHVKPRISSPNPNRNSSCPPASTVASRRRNRARRAPGVRGEGRATAAAAAGALVECGGGVGGDVVVAVAGREAWPSSGAGTRSSTPTMGCGPSSSFRRRKKTVTMASRQIGMLMAKHQRQETLVR